MMWLLAHVRATFSRLVELFGELKGPSNDGRASAIWEIEFEGERYCVYDFIATRLHSYGLPTPADFREMYWIRNFNWSINGIPGSDVEALIGHIVTPQESTGGGTPGQ